MKQSGKQKSHGLPRIFILAMTGNFSRFHQKNRNEQKPVFADFGKNRFRASGFEYVCFFLTRSR